MARESGSRVARIALGVGAGTAALATFVALAVAGVAVQVARVTVTPVRRRVEDIRILAVTADHVTLSSTDDSRLPGIYSLWFANDTGHARIGRIIEATPSTVTRAIIGVDFGELSRAKRGRLGGWVYLGPGDLELPYRDVMIPTPLGPAPAWFLPAETLSGRWLIAIHGRGVRRQECLRAVEAAQLAGYNSLLVSWRNDGDAPASPDGLYGLGDTEWEDADAAIAFAVDEGAEHVVLMGWSMGGAIALQTATRSSRASIIRGLILESPVVDWVTTLHYQADRMGVPRWLRPAVFELLARPWAGRLTGLARPIDLVRLDFVVRANELAVPILLLHSDDDGYVPSTASHLLARARPDIVRHEVFTTARHAKLWNFDPDRWNSAIVSWLTNLPGASARTPRPPRRSSVA